MHFTPQKLADLKLHNRSSPSYSDRIRPSGSAGFGRIRSDSVRFGRIQSDSVGFGRILIFGIIMNNFITFFLVRSTTVSPLVTLTLVTITECVGVMKPIIRVIVTLIGMVLTVTGTWCEILLYRTVVLLNMLRIP